MVIKDYHCLIMPKRSI